MVWFCCVTHLLSSPDPILALVSMDQLTCLHPTRVWTTYQLAQWYKQTYLFPPDYDLPFFTMLGRGCSVFTRLWSLQQTVVWFVARFGGGGVK